MDGSKDNAISKTWGQTIRAGIDSALKWFGAIHGVHVAFVAIGIAAVWALVPLSFFRDLFWPVSEHGLAWSLLALSLFLITLALAFYLRRAAAANLAQSLFQASEKKYQEFYDWTRSAISLIEGGGVAQTGHALIGSFLRTYAKEDERQLTGGEGPPSEDLTRLGNRIYTSFVSYSNLVRSVVEAGTSSWKAEQGDSLTFFTTLRMPLTQWFNHKSDRLLAKFPHVETDENWVAYLKFMFDLRYKSTGKYRLYRILQTCIDCEDGLDFPFIGEMKLWRFAQSRILIKKHSNKLRYDLFPDPFSTDEIGSIIHAMPGFSDARKFVSQTYSERGLAYLLLPYDVPSCVVRGYEWVPVGEAFHNFFCDGIMDGDCYVARLTMHQLGLANQPFDSMPNDVFLSGMRVREDQYRWLLSLGATTDDDCQMVRLEFGTPDLNSARIAKMERDIGEYLRMAKTHNQHIVPLRDWLASEPTGNAAKAIA